MKLHYLKANEIQTSVEYLIKFRNVTEILLLPWTHLTANISSKFIRETE